MPLSCPVCGAHISHSNHLSRHQSSEACRKVQALTEGYKKRIEEVEAEKRDLLSENKGLRERVERAETIVEKAALKSTTIVQNRSRNNYLQYLSSEPIKFSTLQTEIPKLVTAESLMKGERGFNNMIATALLEDNEGKMKLLCTDQARKQFTYKDEKSGELVSDPSLERLRAKMRAGVKYGTLYDEVLEELNACGGDTDDNPEQAYLILHRARFRSKFVNHVAKRAYMRAIIRFVDSDESLSPSSSAASRAHD